MASICNPKWIDPAKQRGTLKEDPLIPSPPPTPPKVIAMRAKSVQPEVAKRTCTPKRLPMARRSLGTRGNKINLLTNHFQIRVSKPDGVFYHYSVAIFYEDKNPVDASKGIGRKIMDKVYDTYKTELAHKDFAYDGEKSLFTVGPLPQNKLEFTVILDDMMSNKVGRDSSPGFDGDKSGGDRKRLRRQSHSKTFIVEISYAAKIPLQAIADALRGRESEHSQEALRVLDIILRQNAAKQGCLLVRQSFFQDRPCNFNDLGGGVLRFRGCHSSFRATQGGLTLNLDMSSTMILRPGPVLDFLLCNQNVRSPDQIDWKKAKKMLKNLRIKTNNMEYTIAGLSDKPCKDQTFAMRLRGQLDKKTVEITVYEYYRSFKHIEPYDSAHMPCIIVGKKNRPTYFPMEFCTLVSLQRYTKALTVLQRAALVEVSRQKPQERMKALSFSLRDTTYASDPMLNSLGISINSQFTHVEGRVLQAPRLRVGNGEDFFPRNGRWNFNNKTLVDPVKIERWAIVNFSARCDTRNLVNEMMKSGEKKGIRVSPPFTVVEENPQFRREQPTVRVEKLFEALKAKLPGPPQFLLCILPERKNSDIYGPWKRKNLSEMGIVTQCIAPTRVNDQYLTNVLLKVNAKLGGMNSVLTVERNLPLVSQSPTLIIGMDVSHGSPGRSDAPSVAAVVGSRCWPSISHYRAEVRTQSPKVEMIASLFQPVSDTTDEGIIRMLLQDFYSSSHSRKPEQIIIFRDGVSESQFNQVLNIELDQIIEACKFLDSSWSPKFTLIVAQKNHNTRFFQPNSPDNVPPGTVIDSTICHPRNNDFYLCAHAGMIGTTRPTHYHVLYDELCFSTDDLQELVHSLSYVYQRSTTAISVVAPVCYAHLAAYQMSQFIKFDDMSESSSSYGGVASPGSVHVPELPKLHKNVCNSMFFC